MDLARRTVLLAATVVVITASGPWGTAQSAFDESEAVLLQPNLGHVTLADTIVAYATSAGTMVPFSEVCRLLSFGITVDAERGKADGFFISDGRRFSLDLAEGFAEVEGRRLPIAPLTAVRHNREIFVDARLLEAWFPLEVRTDLKAALLTFKSKEKLPLEEQWDREGRYAGFSPSLGGASSEGAPMGEYLPVPYRFLDLPFMDLSAS